MSDFTIITTSAIPAVSVARLYDETLAHVREQHPEIPAGLPCIIAAVEGAICNPAYIEQGHGKTYVYVDDETTNSTGEPLRVPVRLVEGTSGRVTTFFFAQPEGARTIVWRKDDA